MSWNGRAKTPTKATGAIPKTTSRQVTPGNRVQDENIKPFSAKSDVTNSRSLKQKGVACNILNKRVRDETSSSSESLVASGTPRTPLSSSNARARTPLTSKRTPNTINGRTGGTKPSGCGTPSTKATANQHTPTKNTPTKPERSETSRSVLVEFSDDIFVTPSRRFASDQGTPTSVSVKTSSTISFHNRPVLPRHDPPHSPLNRSLSASSLSHSRSDRSSEDCNLMRTQSEAKLSTVAGVAAALPCVSGESSRLTVGVRIRPLHHRESGNTVFVTANEIRVASDLGSVHRFTYDYCFPSTGPDSASQEDVYETLVKPLVDTAFHGYNACLFAYGQTGSGKTYSMMGPMHANCGLTAESGIIPRFCREVLERTSALDQSATEQAKSTASSVSTTVEISYLEVYNEKIHDLLAPGSEQLRVREHPVYGPYVVDLSKHTTSTYNELQHWIDIGNQKRATAATEMNDKSSRSHSLFTVILTQTFAQVGSDGSWSHDQTRRSQINLVDLAGSERIAHSSVTSDRLREGVSINKSLLTLGKVMSALVEKRPHVPYRDSVLTWLLKESLGGNSRTTMLATVSPSSMHIDETLSTLRYASQARSIINTVRVNEAPQDKLIRELRAEIQRLRESECGHDVLLRSLPETQNKKQDNDHLQAELKRVQEQLDMKSKDLIKAENRVSAVESDKREIEAKLTEYIENNRQLASMIATEKSDKQNILLSREGETKALVDELVNLREQHKSLKLHYLESQDELELERGAKFQILSEKERDAGQIAALKASVQKLENDLLMEKNEIALRDCEVKKLKSEINEMKLAQDNLTTTFLLKEEFCNAQAMAESEKEELLAAKNKEVEELNKKLESMSTIVKKVNDDMLSLKFLKGSKSFCNGVQDDVENVTLSLKKVKEHLEFLETTNQLLKQQLEQGVEEKGLKDSEIAKLRNSLDKSKGSEETWKRKYEDSDARFNVLQEDKAKLESAVTSSRIEIDKLKSELRTVSENLDKAKEKENSWKQKYKEANTSIKDHGKNKNLLLDHNVKLKSDMKSLEEEMARLKNDLYATKSSLEKSKENESIWKRQLDDSDLRCGVLLQSNEVLLGEKTKLESTVKALEDNVETLKVSLDTIKKENSDWRIKCEEANLLVRDVNEKNDTLQKENAALASTVMSLKTDVKKLEANQKEADRLMTEKIEQVKVKSKKELEEKDKMLSDLKDRFQEKLKKGVEKEDTVWRKKCEEANSLVDDMKLKNEILQKENSTLSATVTSLKSEVMKLEKNQQEGDRQMTEKLEEIKIKSREELEERGKMLSNLNQENDNLKEENAALKSAVMSLEREGKSMTENLKEEIEKLKKVEVMWKDDLEYKDKMLSDLKKEIQSCREARRISQDEKDMLDKVVSELKGKINILESDSSSKNVSELESLRLEIESVRDAMNKLNLAEKEIESLKAENAELKKLNDDLKTRVESLNVQKESAETTEVNQLRVEIQALQERNKYLKKKVRKSKLFSEKTDDSRKLKTEIAQLKRVNLDVASELEKVRGMRKTVGAAGDASGELVRLRAELEKTEKMKTNIDALLQKAKEEMESAMSEMKVLKSENTTLEKRASKAVFENETLREQLAKAEKEKADMLDRMNHMSGEKSVTDYKLRMSLANTKGIEDKEMELKRLQEKNEELKEECGKLRNTLAGLEHQLSLSKLNEDTLKGDLSSKSNLVESLQNEVKAAQQMQRELMEEKLALVKVMEKHFGDENFEDRKGVMSENSSLKKELRMCQQRLDNKCEKMTALNKRVDVLEDLLVKIVDDKIRNQLQLEDLRTALVNKDYSAFDVVMGLYLPHHLEYLVRKARVLTENYKIPYDIYLQNDDRSISFKHLVLKAVAVLNRTLLDKWISKIEEQKGWTKTDDKELPWKVDLDSYIAQDENKTVCGAESPSEADAAALSSALSLGVRKQADGTLDPVEWRRTLIQRHVRGMRDDYRVLIKYFGAEEDSAIYAILERIRAAVDRLEQVTASIVLDLYTK